MKRQEFLEKLKAEHRMFGFKNLIYLDKTGLMLIVTEAVHGSQKDKKF